MIHCGNCAVLFKTPCIVAAATLKVGTNCRVRRMSRSDAQNLAEEVRKRNVFARHAGLRSFYCQRAAALEGVTVVEIYSGGTSTIDVFEKQAIIAENVVAASLVLSGSRREFVSRAVGDRRAYLDLHLVQRDSNLYVSSTSARDRDASGLTLDGTAVARYTRNGFFTLYDFAISNTDLASRIRLALQWLMESRTDKADNSAVVKTATALESLLVFGKEPPTRALSERSAYLLSDDPDERRRLSAAAQRFYDVRGDIVHGKRIADPRIVEGATEFGDRLVVLLALVLAEQGKTWKSLGDGQAYCDRMRWGHAPSCRRPWSQGYLRRAASWVA